MTGIALPFASGFTAVTYEVLWARQLTATQQVYVDGGFELYSSFVDRSKGDVSGSREGSAAFRSRAPHEVVGMFESLVVAPTH